MAVADEKIDYVKLPSTVKKSKIPFTQDILNLIAKFSKPVSRRRILI